jgi:hypothetical protein
VLFCNSSATRDGSWLAQQFPSIALSLIQSSSNSRSSRFEGLVKHFPISTSVSFNYFVCCSLFMHSFRMSQPCKSLGVYVPQNISLLQKGVYFFVRSPSQTVWVNSRPRNPSDISNLSEACVTIVLLLTCRGARGSVVG